MVYTELAPRRQQFHVVPAMPALLVHRFGGYSRARYKKVVIRVESHASAMSLVESGEEGHIKVINNNNTSTSTTIHTFIFLQKAADTLRRLQQMCRTKSQRQCPENQPLRTTQQQDSLPSYESPALPLFHRPLLGSVGYYKSKHTPFFRLDYHWRELPQVSFLS